jgi:hypothetical protein
MALRLSLSGSDILLPDGRPIVLFGTNSRWELAQRAMRPTSRAWG